MTPDDPTVVRSFTSSSLERASLNMVPRPNHHHPALISAANPTSLSSTIHRLKNEIAHRTSKASQELPPDDYATPQNRLLRANHDYPLPANRSQDTVPPKSSASPPALPLNDWVPTKSFIFQESYEPYLPGPTFTRNAACKKTFRFPPASPSRGCRLPKNLIFRANQNPLRLPLFRPQFDGSHLQPPACSWNKTTAIDPTFSPFAFAWKMFVFQANPNSKIPSNADAMSKWGFRDFESEMSSMTRKLSKFMITGEACPLLVLPPEVRNMVYHCLWGRNKRAMPPDKVESLQQTCLPALAQAFPEIRLESYEAFLHQAVIVVTAKVLKLPKETDSAERAKKPTRVFIGCENMKSRFLSPRDQSFYSHALAGVSRLCIVLSCERDVIPNTGQDNSQASNRDVEQNANRNNCVLVGKIDIDLQKANTTVKDRVTISMVKRNVRRKSAEYKLGKAAWRKLEAVLVEAVLAELGKGQSLRYSRALLVSLMGALKEAQESIPEFGGRVMNY